MEDEEGYSFKKQGISQSWLLFLRFCWQNNSIIFQKFLEQLKYCYKMITVIMFNGFEIFASIT